MEKVLAAFVVVFLAALLMPLLGSLVGAGVGWILSCTPLGDWALAAIGHFGYGGDLVDLGALLGFIGPFFHKTTSND